MSSVIKNSAGEDLSAEILSNMKRQRKSVASIAKRCKIGTATLYRYLKRPGSMPLGAAIDICRAIGMKELNLNVRGTYER